MQLFMRRLCCDKTTESGADEVYLLLTATRASDGRKFVSRLPSDSPGQPQGHWDMNDGDQGNDNQDGDSHCITNRVLFDQPLGAGDSWSIAVLVMEEDGGTSKSFQEAGSAALESTGDPVAAGAGDVLDFLTRSGFFIADSDDFIGSFTVRVANNGGNLSATWNPQDRVTLTIDDPDNPGDPLRHEFRWNGDGSNYVGTFGLR